MMDAYICCWSTFFIDKLIICQDIGEKRFSLHHLEDDLTRSLSLLFGTIIVSKLEADVLSIESQSHYVQRIVPLTLMSE